LLAFSFKESVVLSGEERLKMDTLTQIAETTGYDLSTITRWFSSNVSEQTRRSPTISTCSKIGAFYGLAGWQVAKIIEERRA
jgi:hypothetical protein